MNWDEYFTYDHEFGLLRWKVRAAYNVKIGDISGCVNRDGYLRVCLHGKRYRVHRIIWEMENGPIPDGMQIDHIDHSRSNNNLKNLRMISSQDNHKNQSKHSNNTSGFNGVSWSKHKGKWLARIRVNGKTKQLGYFDDIQSAISAREYADVKYDFHPNHGDKKLM